MAVRVSACVVDNNMTAHLHVTSESVRQVLVDYERYWHLKVSLKDTLTEMHMAHVVVTVPTEIRIYSKITKC